METEAPYRRIVAEIRGRIERGDLRPGDRVPSTRAITQDFGVAMATATKVIAALRDAGLVETRSGAGTVVRAITGRRRRGPRGGDLSRDRVLAAAIAIADAEGLAALTMRRVAADLGVATMSLYRHVPGQGRAGAADDRRGLRRGPPPATGAGRLARPAGDRLASHVGGLPAPPVGGRGAVADPAPGAAQPHVATANGASARCATSATRHTG